MQLKVQPLKVGSDDIRPTVYRCPISEQFKFINRCDVRVCMYHSKHASLGCITLSRAESDSAILDEEIAFFKGLRLNKYWVEREHVEVNVKRLVTLRKYVDFLIEQQLAELEPSSTMLRMLNSYPFNIREMEISEMLLPHLFDIQLWKRFKTMFSYEEAIGIKLRHVLGLKRKQFRILCKQTSRLKGITNEHHIK